MPSPADLPLSPDLPPPPLPGPTVLASWDPVLVQRIKDEEHLRLLSICHYVVGGLAILFSCFFIFYILLGTLFLNGSHLFAPPRSPAGTHASPVPAASPDDPEATPAASPAPTLSRQRASHGDEPPAFIGYVMIGFGSAFVLLGWTFGGLLLYSGRCLARHTGRTFSMVLGGISCLQVPLGTMLGVFTLTVLQRPTVRALYAAASQPNPAPAR